MKALPWLRLYTETIDDEKLGLLAFEDRWHFIALLCLKGKGILDSEPDTEMLWRKAALKMGLTVAELEKVVSRLARMKGLSPLARGNRGLPGAVRRRQGPIPARTGQPTSSATAPGRTRAYPRSHGATAV